MKIKINLALVGAAIILGLFSLFNDSTGGGGGICPKDGNTYFSCGSDICDNIDNNDDCKIQVD